MTTEHDIRIMTRTHGTGFILKCSCGETLMQTPVPEVSFHPAVENAITAHLLPQMEDALREIIHGAGISKGEIFRAVMKLVRKKT